MTRPDVTLVTTGHDVADARLHRLLRAAAADGQRTEIVATGDVAGAPVHSRARTQPRTGMMQRARRALVWPFLARGRVLLTVDPDTALAAFLASRLRRQVWVADVHEDYAALLRDRAWLPAPLAAPARWLAGRLAWLCGRADLTLVADEHVPPRQARRRLVVRNLPDPTLLPPLGGRTDGPQSGEWRAVHIGDLRTSRGLREMVEAVAATVDDEIPWRLDLVGPLSGDDLAWFEQRRAQPDARRVHWHGRLPPEQAWQWAADAHVGLCLLADTPAFREAMPTKIYEYEACGLPVVATPLPRVVERVQDRGTGWIVRDESETIEALRRFACDTSAREELVRNTRRGAAQVRNAPSVWTQAARAWRDLS